MKPVSNDYIFFDWIWSTQSFYIYLIFGFYILFLSYFFKNSLVCGIHGLSLMKNYNGNLVIKNALIVSLTLFCGMRESTVGVDTEVYLDLFSRIKDLNFSDTEIENGYLALNYCIHFISSEPLIFLLSYSFIINYLFVDTIYRFRNELIVPLCIFPFYYLLYLPSFNIIRICIAASIIFYSCRFLFQYKFIESLLCIFISILFHRSAVVMLLPLFFLHTFRNKYKSLAVSYFLFFLLFIYGFNFALSLLNFDRYNGYLENSKSTFSIGGLIVLEYFPIVFLLIQSFKYRLPNDKLFVFFNYSIAGFLYFIIGYSLPVFNRSQIYFMVVSIFFVSWFINQLYVLKKYSLMRIYLLLFVFYYIVRFYLYISVQYKFEGLMPLKHISL